MKKINETLKNVLPLNLTILIAMAAVGIMIVTLIFSTNKIIVWVIGSFVLVFLATDSILLYFLSKKLFSQKRNQEYETWKSETIDHLSDTYSHLYNNIFAAILGAAEVLLQSVPDMQKEYVNIIIKNVKEADVLNKRLLNSDKKTEMEAVPVDMHKLSDKTSDENKIERNEKINSKKISSILIVDDNVSIIKVVKAMLNRIGYSVVTAESGFDAIEMFKERSNDIALIILDMIMPNMDGISCFYELKKIKDDVKILISSGLIDNSSIEDMKKDGLCGFIKKPYSYYELENAVANAIKL
ncbi:MAG: response regulator [Chitinispirillales bacterium]|jgi:CheY-like chemotaxis protein|nr:response regulator [Chitinispirillales bacterium]